MAGAKQVKPPDDPVSWMVRESDPDYVDKGHGVMSGLSEMSDPFCACAFSGVEPSAKDGEIPGAMVPTEVQKFNPREIELVTEGFQVFRHA